MNVHDAAGQVVAQWLLDNPYTGPATASHLTDEWVYYPNGALKIRHTGYPAPSMDEEILKIIHKGDIYRAPKSVGRSAPRTYRVRYTVPAEVFKSPEATQQYVAERVTDFIENRDSYEIDPAQGYHLGD